LNSIAPLVFQIFQHLTNSPNIYRLQKCQACVPNFYKPILTTSYNVHCIVNFITNPDTVYGAFMCGLIEYEMFARAVSGDLALTCSKQNIRLYAMSESEIQKV